MRGSLPATSSSLKRQLGVRPVGEVGLETLRVGSLDEAVGSVERLVRAQAAFGDGLFGHLLDLPRVALGQFHHHAVLRR